MVGLGRRCPVGLSLLVLCSGAGGQARRTFDIAGTVLGPDGRPVAGATVTIVRAALRTEGAPIWYDASPDCRKRAATDARGGFRLPACDRELRFQIRGEAPGSERDGAWPVDHRSGPITLRLQRPDPAVAGGRFVLSGRVVDEAGKPVPGATVEVSADWLTRRVPPPPGF